jgi:hypothetical protein
MLLALDRSDPMMTTSLLLEKLTANGVIDVLRHVHAGRLLSSPTKTVFEICDNLLSPRILLFLALV